jgi:hypothetical protein
VRDPEPRFPDVGGAGGNGAAATAARSGRDAGPHAGAEKNEKSRELNVRWPWPSATVRNEMAHREFGGDFPFADGLGPSAKPPPVVAIGACSCCAIGASAGKNLRIGGIWRGTKDLHLGPAVGACTWGLHLGPALGAAIWAPRSGLHRVCTGSYWGLHRAWHVGPPRNLKGKSLGYGLIGASPLPGVRTSCGYDPFGRYARGEWRAN